MLRKTQFNQVHRLRRGSVPNYLQELPAIEAESAKTARFSYRLLVGVSLAILLFALGSVSQVQWDRVAGELRELRGQVRWMQSQDKEHINSLLLLYWPTWLDSFHNQVAGYPESIDKQKHFGSDFSGTLYRKLEIENAFVDNSESDGVRGVYVNSEIIRTDGIVVRPGFARPRLSPLDNPLDPVFPYGYTEIDTYYDSIHERSTLAKLLSVLDSSIYNFSTYLIYEENPIRSCDSHSHEVLHVDWPIAESSRGFAKAKIIVAGRSMPRIAVYVDGIEPIPVGTLIAEKSGFNPDKDLLRAAVNSGLARSVTVDEAIEIADKKADAQNRSLSLYGASINIDLAGITGMVAIPSLLLLLLLHIRHLSSVTRAGGTGFPLVLLMQGRRSLIISIASVVILPVSAVVFAAKLSIETASGAWLVFSIIFAICMAVASALVSVQILRVAREMCRVADIS